VGARRDDGKAIDFGKQSQSREAYIPTLVAGGTNSAEHSTPHLPGSTIQGRDLSSDEDTQSQTKEIGLSQGRDRVSKIDREEGEGGLGGCTGRTRSGSEGKLRAARRGMLR